MNDKFKAEIHIWHWHNVSGSSSSGDSDSLDIFTQTWLTEYNLPISDICPVVLLYDGAHFVEGQQESSLTWHPFRKFNLRWSADPNTGTLSSLCHAIVWPGHITLVTVSSLSTVCRQPMRGCSWIPCLVFRVAPSAASKEAISVNGPNKALRETRPCAQVHSQYTLLIYSNIWQFHYL